MTDERRYSLGKPGCRICGGKGVFPGEPREILTQGGKTIKYPTVVRCSCLEKPIEIPAGDPPPTEAKPDAKSRAAGDIE